MDHLNTPKEVSPPEPASRSVAKSGLRETFVYATIALVAVALGAGLQLHMELEAPLAAAFTLPVALVLLLAHQLNRRGRVIAALRAELSELRRGNGQSQRVMRDPHLGMQTRTPGNVVSGPVVSASPGSGNGRGPLPSGAAPGHGAGPGAATLAQASAHASSPRSPTIAPSGPAQPGGPRHAPVQSPSQMRAPPPALAPSTKAMSGAPAPAQGIAAAGDNSSKSVLPPPLPSAERMPPVLSPRQTGAAMENPVADKSKIAGQVSDTLLESYWGHRPGVPGGPAHADAVAETGVGPAQPQPKLPSGVSIRAVLPAAQSQDGPGERELETMQNLIQQLAAQLNAPRGQGGEQRGTATEPAPVMEQALTQSLSALRTTAATMRQEPKPEPKLELGPKAAGLEARTSVEDDATSSMSSEGAAGAGSEAGPPAPQVSTAPPALETPAVSPYAELARVAEAVAAERIEVFLDPILALADRKARLFEVSVRLRSSDGGLLDPGSIRSIASGTGLLARIDAAKLARSARVAARLQSRGTDAALYSNLARESLADDVFLDTFEDAMAEQDDLPQRLVLSFSQADVRAFNDVHWETAAAMSEIGLRFALEDVADLDMDFERLKEFGFEFVKLDSRVFLEGLPASNGAIPASDLCRHFADLGFTLIVGRIEDEVAHAKLMGFGVLFGQGTFFGGARAVQVEQPVPQVAAA